jgi:hypothetical protein
MNVAMMQPAFMPWQGLFELIDRADIFIFLDDFQFSVQSYHQRNRLFVERGRADWYTVPVLKSVSFKLPLNQTKINESVPWRQKMWKRIQHNYSKAPYYPTVAPRVQQWLLSTADSLAVQNMSFIRLICGLMGINREIRQSSFRPSDKLSSERVVDLLQWCGAKRYYCAKGSFSYMEQDGIFPVADIEVLFQDFKPRAYRQVGAVAGFVPYLSILDALMNIGPEQSHELIHRGTERWLTWDEMLTNDRIQADPIPEANFDN